METFLGESGLQKTWQAPFKKEVECKCGGIARIMFVVYESYESSIDKKFVCNEHKNGGKGDYWVHDSIAVANYLCKDCFETTSILNQA